MTDNLSRIKRELRFIARTARNIEGDFEATDAILRSVELALTAVMEAELEAAPEVEDETPTRRPKVDGLLLASGVNLAKVERVRGFVI